MPLLQQRYVFNYRFHLLYRNPHKYHSLCCFIEGSCYTTVHNATDMDTVIDTHRCACGAKSCILKTHYYYYLVSIFQAVQH